MASSERNGRAARSAQKERFWRRQIKGQASCELTAREWCQREGLSEPSFYAWRRELAKRDRERLATASSPARQSSGFLPIQLTTVAAANVELQLPSGLLIRVPAQEAAALRAILEILEPRSC